MKKSQRSSVRVCPNKKGSAQQRSRVEDNSRSKRKAKHRQAQYQPAVIKIGRKGKRQGSLESKSERQRSAGDCKRTDPKAGAPPGICKTLYTNPSSKKLKTGDKRRPKSQNLATTKTPLKKLKSVGLTSSLAERSTRKSQLLCPEELTYRKLPAPFVVEPEPDLRDSGSSRLVRFAINEESRIVGLLDKQTAVTERVRAVLIDWLMRISSELELPSSTVSLCVVLLDCYTALVPIAKTKYQLVGVAALLIAFKEGEGSPSEQRRFADVLLVSCDGGYTKEQLLEAEQDLAQRLRFRLNPATHHFWVQYLTLRWDYCLESDPALEVSFSSVLSRRPCRFRNDTLESYYLYSELVQLLNASLLLPASVVEFNRSRLVISALYVVLRAEFYGASRVRAGKLQPLRREFECSGDLSFFEEHKDFNCLFRIFLRDLCDVELTELAVTVEYLFQLAPMEFSYELPAQRSPEELFQQHTHNSQQLVLALQLLN